MNEIIIAAISSIGLVAISLINAYVTLKKKNRQLVNENSNLKDNTEKLKIEISAVSVLFNHKFLSILEEQVQYMLDNTKATKFIILFAVNGKQNFSYISVCFERNIYAFSKGATKRYVRFKVDDHYKKMLKTLEKVGTIHLNTDDMPNSVLKSIYLSSKEKIKHSLKQFIRRIKIDQDNDLLLYSSIGTIDDEYFTQEEILIIQQAYDILRYEAQTLEIE